MPTSVEKLVRRIARLEKRVQDNATTPRLSNSSIDDGGVITFNDPVTGDPLVTIGTQPDGTVTVVHVDGPTPPTPTAPILEPALGFITVTWDGYFAAPAVAPEDPPTIVPAPADFKDVEVHASTDPDFVPSDTTLWATITTPIGGGQAAIGVPYDEDYHVRLVTRSLSGKGSEPSEEAVAQANRVESPDIAPYAVTGDSIADFALAVTKFTTLQHMIY